MVSRIDDARPSGRSGRADDNSSQSKSTRSNTGTPQAGSPTGDKRIDKRIRRQSATVRDVAQESGLSITTVSFVLNGHAKRHGIAPGTVRRVEQAARDLNYTPNALARSLRSQRSGAIGLVVPHFRNDWAHRVLEGMYPFLDGQKLVPLVVSHRGSGEQEAIELDSLVQRQVEGIIANPLPDGAERYRSVMRHGIPLVFIGDTLEELPEVSFAAWDPRAVRLPVEHMIERGCRKIAYLGFNDPRLMVRRCFEVYEQTLRDANLQPRKAWEVFARPGQEFEDEIDRLFADPEDRPDGIFALYNDTACRAVDRLKQIGLKVPGDVRVATWGDSPMVGPRAYAITTVHAPVQDEGREALSALFRLIRDPKAGPIHTLVPGEQLIVNQSTAPVGPDGSVSV